MKRALETGTVFSVCKAGLVSRASRWGMGNRSLSRLAHISPASAPIDAPRAKQG